MEKSFILKHENISVLSFVNQNEFINQDKFERKCHLAVKKQELIGALNVF